jgi:hypothetical protein
MIALEIHHRTTYRYRQSVALGPRVGEVFVPGAGWISFDPTNRSVGGSNLIPVAVARDIRQVMPVAGSFVGGRKAFEAMEVEIQVVSGTASARSHAFETPPNVGGAATKRRERGAQRTPCA